MKQIEIKKRLIKKFALIGLATLIFTIFLIEIIPSASWDVSTASYDSVSFNVSSNSATNRNGNTRDLFFKDDGTKMYIIDNGGVTPGDRVYQYTLTTAWDLSTASYTNNFSVNTQESASQAMFINSTGTKMYVVGGTADMVFQYSINGTGQAWNVSNATYDNVNISIIGREDSTTGLFFKSDGTKMYFVGSTNDIIFQYSLSQAWNLSTASWDGASSNFNVSSQDDAPSGLFFRQDGIKMYIIGITNDLVHRYSLSTAWDLSTASYDNVNFSVASQGGSPQGVFFNATGTKMYMLDRASTFNSTVYQYSMANTLPQWSNNYTNSTLAGSTINHTVNWTDDDALSGYIFSFDNGNGSFLNDTFVGMIGTANQSNATKVINSTSGTTIRWIVYANDSLNGLNVTNTFQYTTTSANTCTYSSGNWAVLCSDNCVITSNVDVLGNNITITGTGTFRTTANISNWKNLLIQGTNANNICYVKIDSGGGFKE